MAHARSLGLARVTTATTGTGTMTLGAAVSGFQTFANAGAVDGGVYFYAIKDGTASELGYGTYTASGPTLTRTVLQSTNSDNAINLSGTAEVFSTISHTSFEPAVNPQTGTTYTVLVTDFGKLVTHSNGSAIAVTLPQATGLFNSGWYYYTRNLGAGTVTITPTTSTIDGAATLVLPSGASAIVFSDGTNYQTAAVLPATDAEAAAGSNATKYVTPAQLHEARVDVASATTTDIGAAASNFVRITGTTTITGLGSAAAGVWRDVTFDGALTLTHNGTSLLIPGAANVTTAANDRMRCRSLGSGNWIVLEYTKADGTPVSGGNTYATISEVQGVHTTGTVTSGTTSLTVASATGIVAGMFVVGEGITPGTTVSSIVSTTVTLSQNANATLSADPVSFFIANKATSPGTLAGQLCRAWVNFDGTGTVTIRASYNVSSITDNGTGNYTINFTTAMPDANYAAVGMCNDNGNTSSIAFRTGGTFSTTGLQVSTSAGAALADNAQCLVAVFR